MTIQVNDELIDDAAITAAAADYADQSDPVAAAGRALAVKALLRQRAVSLGIGSESYDSEDAIFDALFDREVRVPEPSDEECRRFYDARPEAFTRGELFEASHILFAVTPGAPVNALRGEAEARLFELRKAPEKFADYAKQFSNCPSGQLGGNLGQIDRDSVVPEFYAGLREFIGKNNDNPMGILPQLVRSRYGMHIVYVERYIPGRPVPYEMARERIAEHLRQKVRNKAVRQYVSLLAGEAKLEGVDLNATTSPLLQ